MERNVEICVLIRRARTAVKPVALWQSIQVLLSKCQTSTNIPARTQTHRPSDLNVDLPALLKLREYDFVERRWPFNIRCCFDYLGGLTASPPEIPQTLTPWPHQRSSSGQVSDFRSVYFWPTATARMRLDKTEGLNPAVKSKWRLALRSLAKWLIPPGRNPCSTSLFGPRLSPLQQS